MDSAIHCGLLLLPDQVRQARFGFACQPTFVPCQPTLLSVVSAQSLKPLSPSVDKCTRTRCAWCCWRSCCYRTIFAAILILSLSHFFNPCRCIRTRCGWCPSAGQWRSCCRARRSPATRTTAWNSAAEPTSLTPRVRLGASLAHSCDRLTCPTTSLRRRSSSHYTAAHRFVRPHAPPKEEGFCTAQRGRHREGYPVRG